MLVEAIRPFLVSAVLPAKAWVGYLRLSLVISVAIALVLTLMARQHQHHGLAGQTGAVTIEQARSRI